MLPRGIVHGMRPLAERLTWPRASRSSPSWTWLFPLARCAEIIRSRRPIRVLPSLTVATEREKMLTSQMYDPLDAELVAARKRTRDLCQQLNCYSDMSDET